MHDKNAVKKLQAGKGIIISALSPDCFPAPGFSAFVRSAITGHNAPAPFFLPVPLPLRLPSCASRHFSRPKASIPLTDEKLLEKKERI